MTGPLDMPSTFTSAILKKNDLGFMVKVWLPPELIVIAPDGETEPFAPADAMMV